MFRRTIRYSQKCFGLSKKLKDITDRRLKPQIATAKIAVSIFSLQMANLGSIHDFSQSVLSPSPSTIARVADTMSLDDIREVGCRIYKEARKKKMLSPYGDMWTCVIDGKEITTSDYCKCGHCKKRKRRLKDGSIKYEYYHQVTAFILATKDFSFTLDVEPILPGEGEKTSAYRLLERLCRTYPKAFSVLIGDGLYLNGKIFKLMESHHKKVIAVLKEERRQLYQEAKALCSLSEPETYTEGKTSYRVWEHLIPGCWDGYGKAVRVIVSEETTKRRVHSEDGKGWKEVVEVTNWMWATNLDESDSVGDLKNTVKICHCRWHIENRCFKETADMWNVDHIYRHSENGIIVFLLFLFMAVNIFNIFATRNIKDRKIKTKLNLIKRIRGGFYALKRPLSPIPIPI